MNAQLIRADDDYVKFVLRRGAVVKDNDLCGGFVVCEFATIDEARNSAMALPGDWLEGHREFGKPMLEELVRDPDQTRGFAPYRRRQ